MMKRSHLRVPRSKISLFVLCANSTSRCEWGSQALSLFVLSPFTPQFTPQSLPIYSVTLRAFPIYSPIYSAISPYLLCHTLCFPHFVSLLLQIPSRLCDLCDLSLTHAHTHVYTHKHSRTHSRTHSHTCTHTHTHTHARTHTHTHRAFGILHLWLWLKDLGNLFRSECHLSSAQLFCHHPAACLLQMPLLLVKCFVCFWLLCLLEYVPGRPRMLFAYRHADLTVLVHTHN